MTFGRHPSGKVVAGPIDDSETEAANLRTTDQPLGRPGRPFDRRSPFYIGLMAAAGVAVTYGVVNVLISTASILTLVGLSFFLAVGLDPACAWLVRRHLRRGLAVTVVFAIAIAGVAGFVATAIPPLSEQTAQLIHNAPDFVRQAQDHSSLIGKINDQFHLQQRITELVNGPAASLLDNVVNAGTAILSAVADAFIVAILTAYFLVDLPRIRTTLYRFFPRSRRARAILIGDEVFAKVGAYVLGNILISLILGLATFVWLSVFDVPYPVLLAIFVAILDLIPIVGSTIAGIAVAAAALTVSLPVCLATIGFFVAFRFGEDYILVPSIIGRAVRVPGIVTIIALLIGGSLLGVIGALVAIPVAAALQLLVQEVVYVRLDAT